MKQIYFITSDLGVWHGLHWEKGPYPFNRIAQKATAIKGFTGMDLRIMIRDKDREQDITEWVCRMTSGTTRNDDR